MQKLKMGSGGTVLSACDNAAAGLRRKDRFRQGARCHAAFSWAMLGSFLMQKLFLLWVEIPVQTGAARTLSLEGLGAGTCPASVGQEAAEALLHYFFFSMPTTPYGWECLEPLHASFSAASTRVPCGCSPRPCSWWALGCKYI